MRRHTSKVEFKPVVAPGLGNSTRKREAIDVFIDGRSLSETLDLLPLDHVTIQSMAQQQWFTDGVVLPVVCGCGDSQCSDARTIVKREGPLVYWTLPNGETVTFDAETATASLRAVLAE